MKKIPARKKNKYYQLINNSLLFALGSLGSRFIVFVLMPLYTNTLTTQEYGIAELVITGVNFVIPFVSLSIKDATLRFTLDKSNKSEEVLSNSLLMVFIGTIITCLLYPLMDMYKAFDGWTQYFLIITILYMLRDILAIYLKSIEKVKLFAIDSICYTLLLMISNIIFLTILKLGLKGYFLATIISTIGSIIMLLCFGRALSSCKISRVNLKLLKNMVWFSIPMIFNSVSWWIINSSDKVMVEYFDTASASGIYSVAAKIPSLLTTLTSIFNQAWIISSVVEYDTTRDKKFYTNIFSVFHCVLVIIASGIILIIRPFMQIYVGESFVISWKYVPLLLLGSIFSSYAAFFGAIYTSAKKNVSIMVTTLMAAIINVILNFILIPRVGIQGAVIATAVAYFFIFIFRMFDSRKYVRFDVNGVKILVTLLMLTLQSILTLMMEGKECFILSSMCFLILIGANIKTIKLLVDMIKNKISSKKKTQ